MDNKIDRSLLSAFGAMIAKSYDKISVTNLCKKANISRASFYTHYHDADDFIKQVKAYLLKKFCRQMELIMLAEDAELENMLKKKNLLFDDTELGLLHSLAIGSNYLDFARDAKMYMLKYEKDAFKYLGEENYLRYRDKIIYFTDGFFMLLYFNLVNYNEEKMKYEIFGARAIAKNLFSEFLPDCTDGNWYKTTTKFYK